MRGVRRRGAQTAGFALLALVGELTGRSLTLRLDLAVHVRPRAAPMAPYYPFLLAGIRLAAALGLAWVAWRLLRAHLSASAGESLLRALGQQRRLGAPRFRLTLRPRLWLAAFGATSLWYLVQSDSDRIREGRWPLLAPWLHTYALPVFAVLSVVLALGWGAVRDWLGRGRALRERHLRAGLPRPSANRRRWRVAGSGRATTGLRATSSAHVFESRPPPLPA